MDGYETRQRELQAPCAYLKKQRQERVGLVEEPRPGRAQSASQEKCDPKAQRLVERGPKEVDAPAPRRPEDL